MRSKENKIKGVITWNGYFYGFISYKSKERYYKSKTVRFDDSMGGTIEVTENEYRECAKKYANVMN